MNFRHRDYRLDDVDRLLKTVASKLRSLCEDKMVSAELVQVAEELAKKFEEEK